MSVSIDIRAMYCFEVAFEDLFEAYKEDQDLCHSEVNQEHFRLCPECGRSNTPKTLYRPKKGLEAYLSGFDYIGPPHTLHFYVENECLTVGSLDIFTCCEQDNVYIGQYLSDDHNSIISSPLTEIPLTKLTSAAKQRVDAFWQKVQEANPQEHIHGPSETILVSATA